MGSRFSSPLVGGALSAGGAGVANMILDRDIDARMKRTSGRPLVRQTVPVAGAVVWSLLLETAAAVLMMATVGTLAALLALAGAAWYVGVYTA